MARRLSFSVNEIGMAFFFALMAQEVTEAVAGRRAAFVARWTLPVAAIGGIVGAVTVYIGYVQPERYCRISAPIACAIDAAPMHYVLRMILPRSAAVPFALLIAIVTDVVALVIVAPWHLILEQASAPRLLAALGLAALLRVTRVRAFCRTCSSGCPCGWRSTGKDCTRRSR